MVRLKKSSEVKRYIASNEAMGEILDFAAALSRDMLVCGANVERVSLAVYKITHAYGLHDVCPYILSNYVSISARSSDGTYGSRQMKVPPMNVDLERLRALNRLSYSICEEVPPPFMLSGRLKEGCRTRRYPWQVVLGIRALAMACMSLFFGADLKDMIFTAVLVVLLNLLSKQIEMIAPDRMLVNVVYMLLASFLAVSGGRVHLCSSPAAVITTIIMVYLPGFQLVNAARNLFCGNEMNGILQLIKALFETIALAVGVILVLMSVADVGIKIPAVSYPAWFLVLLSFLISSGIGVGFGIIGKDILLAGLCGALSRVVLLIAMAHTQERLVYILAATLVSSLFAEIVVTYRHEPSTYLIYPSIIPLIPGDLFFYMILGICFRNEEMIRTNGSQCAYALIGLSVGFMLSSMIAVHIRRLNFVRAGGILPHMLHRQAREEDAAQAGNGR